MSTFDASGAGSLSFDACTNATLGGLQGASGTPLNNTTPASPFALDEGMRDFNPTPGLTGNGHVDQMSVAPWSSQATTTIPGAQQLAGASCSSATVPRFLRIRPTSRLIRPAGCDHDPYSTAQAWLASGLIATSTSGAIALTSANTDTSIDFGTPGYNTLSLGIISCTVTYGGTMNPGTNGYLFGAKANGHVASHVDKIPDRRR